MQALTVTRLARAAKVGSETVRHYETLGLLPKPARTPGGYRVFPADAVRRMSFIRRAKALGFTLPEVRELLAVSDRRHGNMKALHASAAAKLKDLDQRIAELTRIREGLAQLVKACPGHGALEVCPILAALTDAESNT